MLRPAAPAGDRPLMLGKTDQPALAHADQDPLCEDALKHALGAHLKSLGWTASKVAFGKTLGIDIDATKGSERWIIEVKGCGSRPAMRVNYFLALLGELLQRMTDGNMKYSIALPDLPQFRGLWKRLPDVAKTRTKITALFVDGDGHVIEDP